MVTWSAAALIDVIIFAVVFGVEDFFSMVAILTSITVIITVTNTVLITIVIRLLISISAIIITSATLA